MTARPSGRKYPSPALAKSNVTCRMFFRCRASIAAGSSAAADGRPWRVRGRRPGRRPGSAGVSMDWQTPSRFVPRSPAALASTFPVRRGVPSISRPRPDRQWPAPSPCSTRGPATVKIYTKTGDDGTTGLLGNRRVRKDDLRIEAYGTIDELNAVLGIARASRARPRHRRLPRRRSRTTSSPSARPWPTPTRTARFTRRSPPSTPPASNAGSTPWRPSSPA